MWEKTSDGVCVCVCIYICIYIFHHVKASALEPYFVGNVILFGTCLLHSWKEMVGCDGLNLGYKDSFSQGQ